MNCALSFSHRQSGRNRCDAPQTRCSDRLDAPRPCDAGTRALLNLLVETIETDRYPYSPRIWVLRDILAKFGSVGWV